MTQPLQAQPDLFFPQGERLSHAVGCAFAACLERKQRREKECGVTAAFDASRTSFAREGSFRLSGGGRPTEREAAEKKKGGCDPEGRAGHRAAPGWDWGSRLGREVQRHGDWAAYKAEHQARGWITVYKAHFGVRSSLGNILQAADHSRAHQSFIIC